MNLQTVFPFSRLNVYLYPKLLVYLDCHETQRPIKLLYPTVPNLTGATTSEDMVRRRHLDAVLELTALEDELAMTPSS